MFIDTNAEINVINLAKAHGTTNATALIPMMVWGIRQGDKVEIAATPNMTGGIAYSVNGHELSEFNWTSGDMDVYEWFDFHFARYVPTQEELDNDEDLF